MIHRILLAFAALFFFSIAAQAQLPSPELYAVYPPVVKAGVATEVAVEGLSLDGLKSLVFSIPNVKAAPVLLPKNEFRKHPIQKGKAFTVTIPANAKAGLCEVRSVSFYGVSNPKIIRILGAAEKLNPVAATFVMDMKAPELKSGEHAFGKFDTNQIDYFRFAGKKGQKITLRCEAEFLDSAGDATMIVKDGAGQELASSRDFNYRDPEIHFTVPVDGNFWIGVHDFTFVGGGTYHLELTATPVIDAVFPPFGKAGTTQKFTLFGADFPGGKNQKDVSVAVPAGGDFSISPASPINGMRSAFTWKLPKTTATARIGISKLPPVLRQEKPGVQKITVPSEIAGKLSPKDNFHQFRFATKKGLTYFLEVTGDAIQGRVDPYLLLERITKGKDGKETTAAITEGDDFQLENSTSFPNKSRDPRISFVSAGDLDYRITVVDQFGGRGNFPFYQLSVHTAQPDFELIAAVEKTVFDKRYVHLASVVLRKGATFPIRVMAIKKDGLKVPITVTAEGLPAGVTAAPATIYPGADSTMLVLKADAKAAAWTGAIRIKGKAKIGKADVIREARSASVARSAKDLLTLRVRTRLEAGLVMSVIDGESAPVFLGVDSSKPLSVVLGQKLVVPVKLEAKNNLKGNLLISPLGLAGMKTPPVLTLATTKNDGKLTIPFVKDGKFAAKVGTFTFVLKGVGTATKYRHYLPGFTIATENTKHLDALIPAIKDKAKKARAVAMKAQLAKELVTATTVAKEKDVPFAAFSQTLTVIVKPVPPKKPAPAKK